MAMLSRSLLLTVGSVVTVIPKRILLAFATIVIRDKSLLEKLDYRLNELVRKLNRNLSHLKQDESSPDHTISYILEQLVRG